MANRQADPDAKVRYLVQAQPHDFIIEIAASWKVTFGAINPGAGNGYEESRRLHCLRVWEGEKCRAVFANVSGLRDLSIPFAVKIEKQTGSAEWSHDSEGNFDSSVIKRVLPADFETEAIVDPFGNGTVEPF